MTEQQKKRVLQAKRNLFDTYYSFLNPEQRNAVYTVNGPLLILAGAGSGKTTVLVNRIGYIIKFGNAYYSDKVPDFITEDSIEELENARSLPKEQIAKYLETFAEYPCRPYGVLAFTFTNKAAEEIKNRLTSLLGDGASDIWTGTFHKVCMKILRRHYQLIDYPSDFGICDTDDAKKVCSQVLKDLNIDEKQLSIKAVLNEISRAKEQLLSPEEYAEKVGSDAKFRRIALVYTQYQKTLKNSGLLDFDDIIMKTVELLEKNEDVLESYRNGIHYVLVDEYQDTNKAQFVLTSLLTNEIKRNIMVVGDDDQSIYKFRGATIENILNFDKTYADCTVIKLEQNYRSTSNILNSANDVIQNNHGRHAKKLWCDSGEGEKVVVKEEETQNDESRYLLDTIDRMHKENGVPYKNFAILYRANAQSRALESYFAKSGMPYRIFGAQKFYDREEIKDVLAYLYLINNKGDNVHLRRILNKPKRKIGDASIDVAFKIAEELGKSAFEIVENALSYEAIPKLAATSMIAFAKLIHELTELATQLSVPKLIKEVCKQSGYEAMLISAGQAEEERLENINALCDGALEYEQNNEEPSLRGFLEEVTLVSDIDKYNADADCVTLMTIHSAKGMEFDTVFLIGMEEGIFPSMQAIDNCDIEEERRLCYVAITRAKRHLFITHAKERMLYGTSQHNFLSRFIKEINPKFLEVQKSTPFTMARSGFWEAPKKVDFSANTVKKPEQKATGKFEIGMRILHRSFGEGVILNKTQTGGDFVYEIAFDTVGTKKLIASFAEKIMSQI